MMCFSSSEARDTNTVQSSAVCTNYLWTNDLLYNWKILPIPNQLLTECCGLSHVCSSKIDVTFDYSLFSLHLFLAFSVDGIKPTSLAAKHLLKLLVTTRQSYRFHQMHCRMFSPLHCSPLEMVFFFFSFDMHKFSKSKEKPATGSRPCTPALVEYWRRMQR